MLRLCGDSSHSYPGRPDLLAVIKVVSSESTGRGYRFPNVPAQMQENSALSVRHEIKTSRQETSYTES